MRIIARRCRTTIFLTLEAIKMVGVKEAAKVASLSVGTIWDRISHGTLKAVKVGGGR
jgi:hypothetical protein